MIAVLQVLEARNPLDGAHDPDLAYYPALVMAYKTATGTSAITGPTWQISAVADAMNHALTVLGGE